MERLDELSVRATRSVSTMVRALLAVTLLLAQIAMVGLFLAGLLQLAKALGYGLGWADWRHEYASAAVASIKTALKGLELFFLAPLPAVVLQAIRRHAGRANPELSPPGVRDELVMAKSVSLTLLLALVASALAERALSDEGLTYEPALSGAAVILALGLFILGLKRSMH
ncbi:MAG: hypothetical protein ACYTHK_12550 [Planctomycetota bacterium]|jgi:hypothetical protein